MRIESLGVWSASLSGRGPSVAASGDRFTPASSESPLPDMRAMARALTAPPPVPQEPRAFPSSHTNPRGRPWLDEQGVAYLCEGSKVHRQGPDGQPLEPLELPLDPGVAGVKQGPDGILFYLSQDGAAVACKDGQTMFSVPTGARTGCIAAEPDGNYLVGADQKLMRLSPAGEVLQTFDCQLGEGVRLLEVLPGPDGAFFTRSSDQTVRGFSPSGEPGWQQSFANPGNHSGLQLSNDGQTLYVNGVHKKLVGLDVRTGEPRFTHPIGKAEGYWSCSNWVELEDGQRSILTEGGKILRFDKSGTELESIDTGHTWGQINGSVPVLERAGDFLCVMPSVGYFQVYSLDGIRRAEYKCSEVFRPPDYFQSAGVRDNHVVLAPGAFGLARVDLPVAPRLAPLDPAASGLAETRTAVLVGGAMVRKRTGQPPLTS